VRLANYEPKNNRSEIQKTLNNTLIIDCYNANPSSMRSALESFSLIQHKNKLVILADMKELGDCSKWEHKEIIAYCREQNLTFLTFGDQFFEVNERGFTNKEKLIAHLKKMDLKDYLILLKGSRSMQLEELIKFL